MGHRRLCALCGERESDATVAVFVGSECCRPCADDVDAQLGGAPRVEPEPVDLVFWYERAPLAAIGGAR